MKKKQIFLIAIVVIVILVTIFYYGNLKIKVATLREISKKQADFMKKDNYYMKIITKTDDAYTDIDYYKKGEQYIIFANIKNNNTQDTVKAIMLKENGEIKNYCENNKYEILKENGIMFSENQLKIDFEGKSDKEIIDLLNFSNTSIRKTMYNNKECYLYETHISDNEIEKYYIDKENGLVIKSENPGYECEYERKFDCVEDSIFSKIDLSEYTLIY